MGRSKVGAIVLLVALAACAKKEEPATTTGETAAVATPAPAPETAAPAPANLPAGITAAQVAEGKTIFTSTGNCFTCHGPDAKGTPLAPDLTDNVWLNIDATYPSMVKLVTDGVPKPKQHPAPMPPKGGAALTDQQVNDVAAYVWSLGGGK
jgi:mono/diheme cytochrome c family protein